MSLPVTAPVIGVIGGGQLARMMSPEASELGIELRVLAESPESCAAAVIPHAPVGDHTDLAVLREFARRVDVVTFDHEHVPTEHLRVLEEEGVAVRPGPQALVHAQDKIRMREAVDRLGLPNPRWAAVADADQLLAFGREVGWPVVLKTPRGGYDGKGVMLVAEDAVGSAPVRAWFEAIPQKGWSGLLVEEKVPFTRELSALVARRPSGEVRAWDVVESVQTDSVCDEVTAPAPGLDPQVAAAAQRIALRLAEELGVSGVMAAELFEVPGREGGVLVNELAMRPHNSGHWTQDGAVTSQFEQHLRAVLDLPLGSTAPVAGVTVMKNVLGGANEDLAGACPAAMAAHPEAKVHLYGKAVRPGRKVGHVNLSGPAAELAQVRRAAREAAAILRDGPAADPAATDPTDR
ncbi:5-(carboxyamino)imidazole ribonucleotide synthase [Rothia kristinae]|uniref:N5-carboxyaminoimidazole ribonucleotide synthase n=1 Tax=Rothia kristinae TaxID=37923 RepID=A0A199NVZ9_9MICC|nr:5-(carboxyamino)imidazole ribonucleotide synthase [Rothia kristinae]MCA1170378.1 5-(carboxyamino)imidazole ribonucleotide synthase [Rothia kristinae]MED6046415.1 5-(carboxyamino)imidazole ribonucleotide synthase [Rothia kristinae]OAX52896.1 5-(carboxyamino)imidazole ribonucleotide synthase [Rothia kristinae]WGH08954.1 5-(carboxyamino)imidazole ribonucleotide synthase [Rothia kristinae]